MPPCTMSGALSILRTPVIYRTSFLTTVSPRPALARWLAGMALMVMSIASLASPPEGYPSDYNDIVTAAKKEGQVVVYSTTDLSNAAALVRDFEQRYPGIRVEYADLGSDELHQRFLAEVEKNAPSADVLWSSAMDKQLKLANDNYAERYRSPEAAFLPHWAVWRDTVYGTTFEPAVFVYNKRAFAANEIPRTHADLARLLQQAPSKFSGNVTSYDIERSDLGLMLAMQDQRLLSDYWDLVQHLGRNAVKLETSTAAMVQRIAAGKYYLGYNVLGSYALARARHDPNIGVVLPTDYTMVMSRVALINKKARHPYAAKLWLDHMLSRQGQSILSEKAELFSIRTDLFTDYSADALQRGPVQALKPIALTLPLLVFLDRAKQQEFIKRWNAALRGPTN